MSPRIRIGRRGSRSTQTPAGSEMSRNGANSTTKIADTWNGVASRVMIATSGRAKPPICEPNWLIVSADQSFRKSPCRQRPLCGQSLRMPAVPAVERADEAEGVALGRVRLAEVAHQLVEPATEAARVGGGEAGADEPVRLDLGCRLELDRRRAQRHRRHGVDELHVGLVAAP